jgi:hypothetical protein
LHVVLPYAHGEHSRVQQNPLLHQLSPPLGGTQLNALLWTIQLHSNQRVTRPAAVAASAAAFSRLTNGGHCDGDGGGLLLRDGNAGSTGWARHLLICPLLLVLIVCLCALADLLQVLSSL